MLRSGTRLWACALWALWLAAASPAAAKVGECVSAVAGTAAVAGAPAKELPTIVVEGFGDVVNRFYVPELNFLQEELGASHPFRIVFADYSNPAENDLERTMRLRRVEEVRARGYEYVDKRTPEGLAAYETIRKANVLLACPGKFFIPLTKQWLARSKDSVVYGEKPLANSVEAAYDLMETLDYRDPRFRAIDSYAYKMRRTHQEALDDIAWLGGIDSLRFIATENRSGSDPTSATPREFKHRDGAIERENRVSILGNGVASDFLPHFFAVLRYYVRVPSVRPIDVWAFRYRGVDGDPKKETELQRETLYEATFGAVDLTGAPLKGRVTVGKGVRSREAGPEAENNAKLLKLAGKNGRSIVFDLRGSGEDSGTARYYEKDGTVAKKLVNEAHPYRALFRDMILGRSLESEQSVHIEEGVSYRTQERFFTRAIGRDRPIPLHDGGMGGAHARPAPYSEDVVAKAEPVGGPNAKPAPTLADLGLPADRDVLSIGIGRMGLGFAKRFADTGHLKLVVSDIRPDAEKVLADTIQGDWILAKDLREAVARLKRPRKIMLLVTNERVFNVVADQLSGLLEPGDVVIDGGNSNWKNTEAHQAAFAKKGIHMIGMGVSGGRDGAMNGSAMTAGGDRAAWEIVAPMLEAIAGRVPSLDGKGPSTPSVGWVGPGGAGHFAKMAHNGAEYAELEVLAEIYGILRDVLKMSTAEIRDTFQDLLKTKASSFLLETAVKVLGRIDEKTGRPLVELVRDEAQQNGTGMWTALAALELGASAPALAQAVFNRNLSAMGAERTRYSALFATPEAGVTGTQRKRFLDGLADALYASRLLIYAQAFQLIQSASKAHFHGEIDMAKLTNIWRTGSILKSPLLDTIHGYFAATPTLANLLDVPEVQAALNAGAPGLSYAVNTVAGPNGYPTPCLSSVLQSFYGFAAHRMPHNLVMAVRNAFGGHPFWRNDDAPGGPSYDDRWTNGGTAP